MGLCIYLIKRIILPLNGNSVRRNQETFNSYENFITQEHIPQILNEFCYVLLRLLSDKEANLFLGNIYVFHTLGTLMSFNICIHI